MRLEIITSCSDTGRKMKLQFSNFTEASFSFFLARRFRDHTLWFPAWTVWWFIYQHVFQTGAFAEMFYKFHIMLKGINSCISRNNILKGNEWLKSIWKIYKKYSPVLLLDWLSHWYSRWQTVAPAPEALTFSFLTYFKINIKHWMYVSDVSIPLPCTDPSASVMQEFSSRKDWPMGSHKSGL